MHHYNSIIGAVIVTMYWNVGLTETSSPKTEHEFSQIQKGITQYDRVMLVSCSNPLDQSELSWLKQIVVTTTTWTGRNTDFNRALKEDAFPSLRFMVLLTGNFEGQAGCIYGSANGTLPLNLADWVILRDGSQPSTSIRYRGKQAVCSISSGYGNMEEINGTIYKQTMYSASCISEQMPHLARWRTAFDGREVIFACVLGNQLRSKNFPTSCEHHENNATFDILRAFNATLRFKPYADYFSSEKALLQGDADVMMNQVMVSARGFNYFFFPEIVEYRYETFYAWKGESTVSFVTFILHSWAAIVLVLVVITASLIALISRQCLKPRRRARFSVQADWAMFLMASFLATSSPPPCEFVSNSGGRYKKSQEVMVLVWLLGVLPLSVYFRGELISSLAVTIPPDPIDTVDELDAVLDQGRLLPCTVKEYALYFFVMHDRQSSNKLLRAKLRASFKGKFATANLISNDWMACLNSCATRPGFACFLFSLGDCYLKADSKPYVESQDLLAVALISNPVRKYFPLAKQYNKVTQRIFETALNPYAFNNCRQCAPNTPINPIREIIDTSSKRSLVVYDIHSFLSFFLGLLVLSVCVFCVEIFISSKW